VTERQIGRQRTEYCSIYGRHAAFRVAKKVENAYITYAKFNEELFLKLHELVRILAVFSATERNGLTASESGLITSQQRHDKHRCCFYFVLCFVFVHLNIYMKYKLCCT